MGGHGGLNILPQKRWNVYNFDNREKVRKDEEAAAKDEQLKREQSRKRDTELRVQQLRQARGAASESKSESKSELKIESLKGELKSESLGSRNDQHINLFEGIKVFDPIDAGIKSFDDDKRGRFKQLKREATKMKKENEARVVDPEDEKYKLGYGLVGKGVELPWYMSKKARIERSDDEESDEGKGKEKGEGSKRNGGGKKTIEEMREERLKRERRERERVKMLLSGKGPRDGPDYKDRYYTKRR